MFTGIVETVGTIKSIDDLGSDSRLVIDVSGLDMDGMKQGDSIAVNGVCLTVTTFDKPELTLDVSGETLSVTNLGKLQKGSRVNLERPMLLSDRLHGHIVSGHVDAVGKIAKQDPDGRSVRFTIDVPAALHRYLSKKGSVSVDGVSLTINEKTESGFSINIIPHTLEKTIFSDYRPGSMVNIEVDIIARYLESLQNPA